MKALHARVRSMDLPPGFRSAGVRNTRIVFPLLALVDRGADDELAAGARAPAVRLDRAAVELDQVPDQRQPDPQAALGAIEPPVCLREQIEDARQELR